MKKYLLIVLASALAACFIKVHPAAAAFNGNNLIVDSVFDNTSTMNAAAIDTWLNSNFPNSCISTNNHFSAPDPTGYNPNPSQFLYSGSPVSAGQVVYDAAQAYSINPQVLLATIEKEENLVTGVSGCPTWRYTSALGYGCTDSGTNTHNYSYPGGGLVTPLYYINGNPVNSISGSCVNSGPKAGFSEQIIHAAWLLTFSRHKAEGDTAWAVVKGSWNNCDDNNTCPAGWNIPASDACYSGYMTQGNFKRCPTDDSTNFYDGYATIDGSSVHMDNGATAALYVYTPHFHGNQLFVDFMSQWFPSFLWDSTSYKVQDKTGTTDLDPGKLLPGQQYLVTLSAHNSGSATWTNSGPNPVTLATDNPEGHNSFLWDSSWLSYSRPVYLQEASVAPGATGHFKFLIQAPYTVGSYREYFRPVAEMLAWFNQGTDSLGIKVVSPGSFTWSTTGYKVMDKTMSSYVDPGKLQPGQKYTAILEARNTGTATWTNDGPTPVNLGTANPSGRNSNLCDSTWLGCNRPVALQEASVAPGQEGHFVFKFNAPYSTGSYREYFKPVAELFSWFNDINEPLGIVVISPGSFTWDSVLYKVKDSTGSFYVDPGQLQHGAQYQVVLQARNSGSATWQNNSPTPVTLATNNPPGHNSFLWQNSWLTYSRPVYLQESSVAPGATGHFVFLIQVPSSPGSYREYFKPVAEMYSWFNDPTESLGIVVH